LFSFNHDGEAVSHLAKINCTIELAGHWEHHRVTSTQGSLGGRLTRN